MHFWGISGCYVGIICLHTPSKSSLAVILRGQPSFYNQWLTIYGFVNFFAQPRLFPGYFRLTDHDPKMAPVYSHSPRVIESGSEEKMNLYGSAQGR